MKIEELRTYSKEFLSSILSREDGLIFNLDSRELIEKLPDNFVQTVYFDPPFSSKNPCDIPHAEDRESNDLSKFVWFIEKKDSFRSECEFYLKQFKRILKDTGSAFIHLPWELSYDIKVIADKIFGEDDYFKNEIIWVFRRWSDSSKKLQENHHTILWYTKSKDGFTFNRPEMPRAKSTMKRFGDEKIVSAVDSETGKRIPSKTSGKSITAPLNDVWVWDDNKKSWLYELSEVDENSYIQSNRSIWGISHTAPIKKLKSLNNGNAYPFEKPKELLSRLIKMTSKEEDIVLDFFAGSGVTGEACIELNRKYLLNEISHLEIPK